MKNKKAYKMAPLPFQGQKRNFVEPFSKALTKLIKEKDIKVVVDLFGGSGLLSHTARAINPDIQVVYNDFDGFSERLRHIAATNALLADIREIVAECPKDKRLRDVAKDMVIERLGRADKEGFVDYITLSSSLLFSGNYVTSLEGLKKEALYNTVKMKDYDLAADYLDGLDIVCLDYLDLFNQYKDVPGVLFIVDPPYLTTDTATYLSDKYWKLKDYLNVLNVLAGHNYVFFTSNKSSLVELCDWFAVNYNLDNPFTGAILNTHNTHINKDARYTDMMYCRCVG